MDSRTVRLEFVGPVPDSASLLLLPRAIRDIYGSWSDSLLIEPGSGGSNATGALELKLNPTQGREGGLIVQLLDASGRIAYQVESPSDQYAVKFPHVRPERCAYIGSAMALVISTIIMGKQLIEKPGMTWVGIGVIWGGIVLVAIVDLFVLTKVVRR